MTQRDPEADERRRMRAARLFELGWSQSRVARRLDVRRQSASRWYRAWDDGGPEALRARPAPGRRSKLTDEKWARVRREVLRRDGPWSIQSMSDLIVEVAGVRYSPSHVSRLMNMLDLPDGGSGLGYLLDRRGFVIPGRS